MSQRVIRATEFGVGRSEIGVLGRPLLVLSVLYSMVSPHFFKIVCLYIYIGVS